MSANDRQVAGSHYGGGAHQHWDIVVEHSLNYFEGQITKYVMRCRKKNGKQDLEKAKHFIEKYLEVYDQIVPAERPPTEASQVSMWDPSIDFEIDGYFTDMSNMFKCRKCREVFRGFNADAYQHKCKTV